MQVTSGRDMRQDLIDPTMLSQMEKLGRSLCKELPKDPTVAKVIALAMGSSEVLQRVCAWRTANPIHLSVPDAATEKDFLENAKQVYREAHIPNRKRGRRSEENVAIDKLNDLSHKLGRQLTQGEMIKSLIDHLKLGKNTAGKYAKLYRLSRQDRTRLSQADQRWLCKNFGSESGSPAWWDERFWQWFEERVRSSGLGEEIRKLFAGKYTLTELQRKWDETEACRLKLRKRYANKQRQVGITNAKDVLTKKRHPRPKMRQRTPG